VLVNNAGVVQPIGHIEDLNVEEWADCFAVNTIGAFRCTKAFLPLLLKAKGTIINISSGAAYRPLEGWSAYCSTKAALVMLSRVTAHEYSERGIRVFSLSVEPTDTEMQTIIRNSGVNPISAIPRDNLVPASRIASAIMWLCGPEAQILKVVEIDVRDPLFAYLLTSQRDSQ
jgi:NAD(P)-dependent dehydrogenase (short-subunit alcohol dehydrogenase family)